ncbi:MAG: T9SS type A sorting domain-containing protein [Melioribacteraceae bacterium]|nr:T9SS type A sorting domain-containing protein [Melioribacteraceae bacterium]
MKILRSFLLLLLLLIPQTISSQTISSTSSGGEWNATTTWVGGIVPTVSNDVQINGVVSIEGNNSCRNLTISTNGILQSRYYYAGYWRHLFITGNLINNGVIRNHPSGGDLLVINLSGNLTNNNTCENTRIIFEGSGVQNVSLASNKVFQNDFEIANSSTIPKAISNIKLSGRIDFGNNTSFWDMNNFLLTLDGNDITINEGTMKNVKDIIGLNNAILEDIKLVGDVNFKETISIRNVSVVGSLTVTDTLQNAYYYAGYWRHLFITGNLINNGVIRNHPSGGDLLVINLSGNLTNNNISKNTRIIFEGSKVQNISLADNQVFQNDFEIADSLTIPTAISDLHISSQIDFKENKSYWDMNGFSLTVDGNDITINEGTIKNVKDLIGLNNAILEDIKLVGNVNFKETISIRNVSVEGSLTVTDTLQNAYYYAGFWRYLYLTGNLISNGVIRNHPSGGDKMVIRASGDIEINGTATNDAIELSGTYSRTISGNGLADNVRIRVVNSGVELSGDNTISNLEVDTDASCKLRAGGSLTMTSTNMTGDFQNNGKVTFIKKDESGGSFNSYDLQVNIPTEHGLDTLFFSNYGSQVPPTFANAVKEYWSINSTPSTEMDASDITFYYRDELLGNNNEELLEIYHSTDDGKTWRQISTSLNTTKNSEQNYLTCTNAPMYGYYCISSNPDPVSVRPSVILSIIGRNTIRVGPPNRFTFHYVNNSDVESNEMIMGLGIEGEGGFIEEVIPSVPEGAPEVRIPVDSLSFDGRKDSVYLWIGSMEPHEERTFDVILSAVPGLAKTTSPNSPDFVITLSGVLIYASAAIVTSYVKDVAFQLSEEIWRPVADCETVSSALYTAIKDSFKKTNKDWFCREKPGAMIADEVVGATIKKLGTTAISAANKYNLAKDVYTAMGKTHKGMSRYLNNDFKVKDCSGNERKIRGESTKRGKELTKVTSWDPNEKVAPAGFGEGGFITTAGRMEYQILFENKKEATAPAWKIVIIDTLSDNLDPTTVEFGKSSHEGETYNWITNVEGNIVTWEIVDIELPPNVTPPEGEGYVSFSVKTKDNLPSGTELKNSAAITFDLNNPIITNEVVNTIDFLPPTTTVEELVDTVFGNSVTLSWNATDPDNGSGINTTTVYMSDNDGGFFPVATTDQNSLDIDILGDHKYEFYALSKDNVGNIEMEKPNTVSIEVISSVEDEENIPKEYYLSQNYPNPFNPSTKIDFALPFESKVKIEIFNILGEIVGILENTQLNAGNHSRIWNANKLASGIYFIRFIATDINNENHNFTSLKKMILLK